MFESIPKEGPVQKHSAYFLEWMNQVVLIPENLKAAEDVLLQAEYEAPEIRRFRTTPQTPPWHTEGPTVWHHVRRILAGVNAVVNGASILDVEEFSREKDLQDEIIELEQTIRENAGSMFTFALTHDIAKPDVLELEAPEHSRGAREGFIKKGKPATEAEKLHFLKLYKSFELKSNASEAGFFNEFEIESHYPKHAKVGASEKYRHIREAIGGMYHLSSDDLLKLQLSIRYHIDFLLAFHEGVNVPQFRVFEERANRTGIDSDDFLDLLLAFTFIDTTVGSYGYRNGEHMAQVGPVVNFLRSEYEAAPHRRSRRSEKKGVQERRARKAVLQAAGLEGSEIFSLLNVPFGPERGEVMKQINESLDDPSFTVDFGRNTEEMRKRINEARNILTQRVRS